MQYLETISAPVLGSGHFEPLRHYAEVHVLIEPVPGTEVEIASRCPQGRLSQAYQKKIIETLRASDLRGVLINAPLAGVRITLVGGASSSKHTQGPDLTEATLRAVRQGLMEASGVILEPTVDFTLNLPVPALGRVMSQLGRIGLGFTLTSNDGQFAVIEGSGSGTLVDELAGSEPVSLGNITLTVSPAGYAPASNPQSIIRDVAYDPNSDTLHPAGSIFCAYGAGYTVPWDEAKSKMHALPDVTDLGLGATLDLDEEAQRLTRKRRIEQDYAIGTEDVDRILSAATGANRKAPKQVQYGAPKKKSETVYRDYSVKTPPKHEYVLVDAYNVIHAWPEYDELARDQADGLDMAREILISDMHEYQALKGVDVIVVFDAYNTHADRVITKPGPTVVYTQFGETADGYIERFVHDHIEDSRIVVATGDGLIQTTARTLGGVVMSPGDLAEEFQMLKKNYILTD